MYRGIHTHQETSNDVDDVAACEVADTPLREVAWDRPNPMRDKAVHQKVPKKEEDEHRIELHAIGERDRGDASAVAKGKRARGMVFRRQTSSYICTSFEQYGGKRNQDLRDDCDRQLEHDEERLGDGALR